MRISDSQRKRSTLQRLSAIAGNAAALLQTASGDDQSIQVDVTPRTFNGADRWFGLVARHSDANNYYYVTARSGGGLELKKMRVGSYTTLASAALPVAIGHRNRLRLEAVDDHIRVFVEDQPVIRVRDSDSSGATPGLMTYKTSADFDNVVFGANPAKVAYATDFETQKYQWPPVAGTCDRVRANESMIARESDLSGNAYAVISTSLNTHGDQKTPHMQAFLKKAEGFLDGVAEFGFWRQIPAR